MQRHGDGGSSDTWQGEHLFIDVVRIPGGRKDSSMQSSSEQSPKKPWWQWHSSASAAHLDSRAGPAQDTDAGVQALGSLTANGQLLTVYVWVWVCSCHSAHRCTDFSGKCWFKLATSHKH